jgi:hypothetical protein
MERINLEILVMLKKLVTGLTPSDKAGAP